MAKSLVIVESPAKAKTIEKYLGRGYTVRASMGHVRDLPAKTMGVDIEHGFAPTYETLKGRTAVLKAIRTAAKDAEIVYLAPDPDREGEAIAWHIAQALKLPDDKVRRVTFNEITQKAVRAAFEHPGEIDMAKVNAQQARRILDRIVGYQLSPLLWEKVAMGLSAGRVQSVAVRLIVEREKEIRAFKPEEFWEIAVKLTPGGSKDEATQFTAKLAEWTGKEFKPTSGPEAETVATTLRSAQYVVAGVEKKQQKTSPWPPFNTSLLQQQASVQLHFAAKRTMQIAQQLYEGVEIGPDGSTGLITYMRTDSFRVSNDALAECRSFVKDKFGDKYLHDKDRVFKAKKGAQEAHEAIRPTSVLRTPEQVKPFLSADQYKLYDLIWRRFVATQMSDAVYDVTKVEVRAADGLFKAEGRVCVFDGHTRVTSTRDDKDMQVLPPLEPNQKLDLLDLASTQHFTKPPPRYTEASLVRTLEREGIGRPSTYAAIISTIQDRGYVRQEKRAFYATDLGIVVTDLLVISFPDVMNVQFTSEMEEKLDKIEEEHIDWVRVLDEFYKVFKADLEKAGIEMKKVRGIEVPGEVCPNCGKPLLERWTKSGTFIGCSGYPECKYVKAQLAKSESGEDILCEKCGKPMVVKQWRGSTFIGCSGYPECKNTRQVGRDGKPLPPPEATDKVCEKCGSAMMIRTTARGRYLACSAYPKCRNTLKLRADGTPMPGPEPTDEKCEKCGSPMVIRTGKRGRFMACSAFPKCRNAKPLPGDAAGAKSDGAAKPRATRKPAAPAEATGQVCEKCGSPMVIRTGTRGRFMACSAYPKCRNAKPLPGDAAGPKADAEPESGGAESKPAAAKPRAKRTPAAPAEPTGQICEKCGAPMVIRTGTRGRFMACSAYPKCRNAKPLPKPEGAGQPAE